MNRKVFQERGFFIKNRNKIIFPPLTYIHPIVIEHSIPTSIINNNTNNLSPAISIFKTFFKEKFYVNDDMIVYDAQEIINKQNIKYQIKHQDTINLILNKNELLPTTNDQDNHYYNYNIYSFLEESLPIYAIFIDVCIEKGITGVIDIGCASGIQSLFFNMNNINYIGVDSDINNPFFPFVLCNRLTYRNSNDDGQCLLEPSFHNSLIYTNYIITSFPALIENDDIDRFHSMDISSLMTNDTTLISSWCLFYVVHENLETQTNSLINFKSSILNIPNEAVDYLLNNKKFISYMNLEVIATYDDDSIVYIKAKEKK